MIKIMKHQKISLKIIHHRWDTNKKKKKHYMNESSVSVMTSLKHNTLSYSRGQPHNLIPGFRQRRITTSI